ncbi:LysE family translocator [Pseudomonas viridiflava]|uniref:LysE family translocator n=1 Tax=Pseudomonas viridiflava TaxID=33069 RepID=UPI000F042C83|nr:LysE family translocator [Pseudomonas viridiflava]
MCEFSSFVVAPGVYVLGAVSPGPGNLAIANTSLNYGRTPGLALAAGVISGYLCWGVMTAAGVSALLMSSTLVLLWLKMSGACYLFFLAWKSIRGAMAHNTTMVVRLRGKQTQNLWLHLQGFGIHLTNPKAVLIWLTVSTIGLSANAPVWTNFALVASCALMGFLIFCTYALVFSAHSAEPFFNRTRKSFGLICGSVYCIIATGFLSSLFDKGFLG